MDPERKIKWISLSLQILFLISVLFVLTMYISRSLPTAIDEIVRLFLGVLGIYAAITGSIWFRLRIERLLLAIHARRNP